MQREVDENRIPGAVVLIKKGNQIICKAAYGFAQKYDFDNRLLKIPEKLTTEHLFDIASLTKVVGTTTAMMLLLDQGYIEIDDPVGKYIKAFNAPDKQKITIRHLLTHTSGLYEWYPMYYRASNKQEVYGLIGELPLKYPVGDERHYSDLGFTILGQAIETVSGLPLDKYMAEKIFVPLAMEHTLFNPLLNGNFKNIAATSHGNPFEKRMVHDPSLGFVFKEIDPNQWNGWRNYTLKGEVNDGNAWYANGGISGAAGLFSTADDLQKLLDMLIENGKIGDDQFISEKTLNLFLSADSFKNGLGWMMDAENSFMKNGPVGNISAIQALQGQASQ
ncbi:MAG: serine hydrolase [Flavobacteriaceae bacterium]|nr:serine hydrolase [Flavobacteriaceae bacterium]